jgi:predicted sugar kinase
MDDLIQLVTKTYGLVGVILLAPFVLMKFLWSDNKSLRKQLADANERVVATQEKRIEDAKAISQKLIEMSSEHAGLTKETNIALDRVGDTLTVMASAGFYRRPPAEMTDSDDTLPLRGKRG